MFFGGKSLEPWIFCLEARGVATHRKGLHLSKSGVVIFLSGWHLVCFKTDQEA